MSATVLLFAPPCPAGGGAPATESDHGDYVMVNGIEVGTSHWPQPPGHEDRAWMAWYEADEPDERGSMNIGHGSSRERAITDLFFRFPRED